MSSYYNLIECGGIFFIYLFIIIIIIIIIIITGYSSFRWMGPQLS
jgi:uncharacterized membrane protein YdbT with pleckstrin-like domain